jgi:hypothetical protein
MRILPETLLLDSSVYGVLLLSKNVCLARHANPDPAWTSDSAVASEFNAGPETNRHNHGFSKYAVGKFRRP